MTSTTEIASSGMAAQSARLRHVSENIANADTPGYRRKTIPFEATLDRGRETGMIQPGRMRLDPTEGTRIHDPAHPMAGADGTYMGSNVDLVTEIADARAAQRGFEANLKIFEQARQMSSAVLDLLRR